MKYIGFENLNDIKEQFRSNCNEIKDEEILFASYGSQSWDGDAIILIKRNGKLYTVEGGHCSCRGLENQWDMIETTKDALKIREFSNEYHPEFIYFLKNFLMD
jgi:hypothetical protein